MIDRYRLRGAVLVGMVTLIVACTGVPPDPVGTDPADNASDRAPSEAATFIPPLTREPTLTPTEELMLTATASLVTPTLGLDDLATTVAHETLPPTELVSGNRQEEARAVLKRYLGALASGAYEEADALYGGSFEPLWGLTIFRVDPTDRPAIWRRICGDGYLQCLPVRDITIAEATSTAYRFDVTFSNTDGSLFVVGPCCGGNATEHPPVSRFSYTVIQSDGNLLVIGLPPYVP